MWPGKYYYREHIIFYIPPLEKGGGGGFETWENPPKSPFAKGGFLDQGKNRRREKTIKKSKQYNAPGNNIGYLQKCHSCESRNP